MALLIDFTCDGRIIPEIYVGVRYANGAKGGGLYSVRLHFMKGGHWFSPDPEVMLSDIPFVSNPEADNPWQAIGVIFDVNKPPFEQAYQDFKIKAEAGLFPWAMNVRDA